MTRAVAYIRVSTDRQAEEDKVSLDEQLADIESHCQARGYELATVYRDVGHSGASKRRPKFQEMLKAAGADEFDVIICWKSDRLSRGLYPATALMEAIEGTAITIEAVKDAIDLKTFCLLAAVGKIELENIRERTRMGQRGRAARGTLSGTLRYGYALGEDRKPTIDKKEAEVVKFMFSLRAQGVGSWEICRRLNDAGTLTRKGRLWDDQKLWFVLVDPTYTGNGRYGRRQYYTKDNGTREVRKTRWMPEDSWVKVDYPRIVDDWTWQTAQHHIKNSTRERIPGRPKPSYLLHGVLWCGNCQGKYSTATGYAYKYHKQADGSKKLDRTQRLVRKYICGRGKRLHGSCPRINVSAQLIEGIVWSELTRFLTEPAGAEAIVADRRRQLEEGGVAAEAQRIQERLAELEVQRGRVLYQHQRGFITDSELDLKLTGMREGIEHYQQDLGLLESETAALAETLDFLSDYQAATANISDRLDSMSEEEKREVVRLLVNRVEVEGQKYQIILAMDVAKVGVLDSEPPPWRKNLCPNRCPT